MSVTTLKAWTTTIGHVKLGNLTLTTSWARKKLSTDYSFMYVGSIGGLLKTRKTTFSLLKLLGRM